MARILCIGYSQTGQLDRIVKSVLAPLARADGVEVVHHRIEPVEDYPFPWPFMAFLDAFPESIHLDPPAVRPAAFDPDSHFDLIILSWQVWFLAPSLPVTGFLHSPDARVLRGRRVISVIGCRNMWTVAYLTLRQELDRLGAKLVDNVVLTDDAPLWATFITTPWWLLTGNRDPFPGRLPRAGVNEADIARAARFGHALVEALPRVRADAPGPFLDGLAAVRVDRRTMLAERIGQRSFRIWGRIVRLFGRRGALARRPVLLAYVTFLLGAIVFVLPVTMLINAVLARASSRVSALATELEGPSGASEARMRQFIER